MDPADPASGTVDLPPGGRPVPAPQPGRPDTPSATRHPATRGPAVLESRPVWAYRPPARERFATWWSRPVTMLLVLLLLLLLLASTIFLAARAVTGPPEKAADPSPSPTRTGGPVATTAAVPTPTGVGTPGPTSTGGGPDRPAVPPDAVGVPFQTGSFEIGWGNTQGSVDLDANEQRSDGFFLNDIETTRYGIAAVNGAVLAAFTGDTRPRLGQCAAIPLTGWTADAPAGQLEAGTTLCFVTNAGRYGYLTVRGKRMSSGEMSEVSFVFLVWKGPND